MRKPPIIHATRECVDSRFLRVEQLDLEFSNGEKRTYERLRASGLGAVIIVPMLDDDTVLLIREYGAGVGRYELSLPKGRLDQDETAEQGANRELKEEVGYGANRLKILHNLSLSPGYMTHMAHVVLAQDLYPERLPGDEPEELDVVPWKLSELHTLIGRDDVTEGRSIAALFMAREYLAGRVPAMSAVAPETGLLAEVNAIAREAATAILAIYRDEFAVEHKDDASPLTAADLAAQRVIVAGLARIAPDVPVLSEEARAAPWELRQTWSRYWLVDPLDGTREFVKRNGEFTVNIALIEDHRPVLGVVLAPVTGELFAAADGQGAWLQQHANGQWQPIGVRALAAPAVVAGSRSHGSDTQEFLDALLDTPYQPFPMGSSLKFCLIARAVADLYLRLGPTSEWDTAAAQCVLEQAGGAVLDLAGEPLRYNTKDSVLNPEFLAVGDRSVEWKARLGKARPA